MPSAVLNAETPQNVPHGSVLFRNPQQFMVLGRVVQQLFEGGASKVSLSTIGDANATDAFQLLLGVLLARQPFSPNSQRKDEYQGKIRQLALELNQQIPTTRYDKNRAPLSLDRGEFDVDAFVMSRALRESGLAHPFLSVLDVDASRCLRGSPLPTCFKLRSEIKSALGELKRGDVLDTLQADCAVELRVFTVMNMIDTVKDPSRLAQLIVAHSQEGSIVALGTNEMCKTTPGSTFRNALREGGFTPLETPETDEFISEMQEMAVTAGGREMETNCWLWKRADWFSS